MLSARSLRRTLAAAGIAGLGTALPVTGAAPAVAAPALAPVAPLMAQPTADPAPTAPAASASAAADVNNATYTVVGGDTLSEIAFDRNISGGWPALYELNRDQLGDGPDWIDIGQVLKLAGTAQSAPASAPLTEDKPAAKPRTAKPTTVTPKSDTGKADTKKADTPKAAPKAPANTATNTQGSVTLKADKPSTPTAKTTSNSTSSSTGSSTAPAAPAASSKAATAVAFAKAQLGKPYVYGASGPSAYDCSGLTQAAWKAAGVSLPRVTTDQFASGRKVSTSALQPGDLVFYYSGISHVGIYIGNGQIIHAPNSRSVVKIVSVDSMPIAGAIRPA